MSTKIINISLPQELVERIDQAAKGEYASRSDFIRESVVRRLKGQRIVDEWGDTVGEWDEGIDVRDEHGEGMPTEKFLAILEELKEKKYHGRSNKKVSKKP